MPKTYYISQDFFDITIYQYGYEQCKPFHAFGPAIRTHYLIHCILSGKGVFRRNYRGQDTDYHLHAGQAFLIEPNNMIHYWADGDDPWEYMWIEFDGLKAKEYLINAGLSNKFPIFIVRLSAKGTNGVMKPVSDFRYFKFPDIVFL